MYILLMIWNVAVCFIYGLDKWKAKRNKWRISEKTLILSAFFMGAAGAILGMVFFHHKTKHIKFKALLPIALFINIGVIIIAGRYIQAF